MTRPPFEIDGPYKAKRNPAKRYVAIAVAVIAGAAVLLLSGCSSLPPNTTLDAQQQLILDKQVQPMSRNEVITAVTECTSSGLRAVMLYGKRKINNFTTDIVVDVTCAPKY
jgi:type IV pilus biogenesis protein CpaD/CtpE